MKLPIGYEGSSSGQYEGYITDFRISKGIARYGRQFNKFKNIWENRWDRIKEFLINVFYKIFGENKCQ